MEKVKQRFLFEQDNKLKGKSWFQGALNQLDINMEPSRPDYFGDALMKWHNCNDIKPINTLSLFNGAGDSILFHGAGKFKVCSY